MSKKIKTMKRLFMPESVAVVGASEKFHKLGYHVMKSLINGEFKGKIIPINPSASQIMGIKAYPSITQYKEKIDLVIIAVPVKFVFQVLDECYQKKVGGIVLITAGFKEIDDPEGARLQGLLKKKADDYEIPIIGPNTFGMINLNHNLNASFTPEFSFIKKGNISLISQSGGMAHLIGFLSQEYNLGFSKIVGIGNRINVDFSEMLYYLKDDPETKVIALYIEGTDDPPSMLKAIKQTYKEKPIIAYKTGSSKTADMASKSHTGSIAGRYDIYIGALKQAGAIVVNTTEELVDTAKALSLSTVVEGNRIAVLSGQAGPAIAASDVIEGHELILPTFTKDTQKTINKFIPPLAIRTNPVDMGPAWYDVNAIQKVIDAVMKDKSIDAIILLIMYASANIKAIEGIKDLLLKWKQEKPVISCLSAPSGIWDEEIRYLEEKGAIVNYPTPERAAKVVRNLWEYKRLISRR